MRTLNSMSAALCCAAAQLLFHAETIWTKDHIDKNVIEAISLF